MARRQRLWVVLILAWLSLAAGAAQRPRPDLAAADLRAEAARAARGGGPLVILFSRRDCPYCETIRRRYLQPLADDPKFRGRLVIRQVNQDSAAALTGFRGEATSHGAFADGEKVTLVPVVAFYGPGGQPLAEPIVGTRLPDFYQGYLEAAIEQSMRRLKQP